MAGRNLIDDTSSAPHNSFYDCHCYIRLSSGGGRPPLACWHDWEPWAAFSPHPSNGLDTITNTIDGAIDTTDRHSLSWIDGTLVMGCGISSVMKIVHCSTGRF